MKKRGFVLNWQNRHWSNTVTGYDGGGNLPGIPPTGTGALQAFFTNEIRARGYSRDSDGDRYLSSFAYFSPPMKADNGEVYRFFILCSISSPSSDVWRCFGVVVCDPFGRLSEEAGGGDTTIQAALGSNDTRYTAYEFTSNTAPATAWDDLQRVIPHIREQSFRMMVGPEANRLYRIMRESSFVGQGTTTSLLQVKYNGQYWGEFPFSWQELSGLPDVQEIVTRARSLSTYKYWYGGAGQIANKGLLDSLAASYPSIYTQAYKAEAARDFGQPVADCSYLVNYAYGIASPGNHGPGTSAYLSRFARWNGSPKDGMIVWRSGHTGIYYGGNTLEMVGIKVDYREAPYDASKWSAVLYDPNRTY